MTLNEFQGNLVQVCDCVCVSVCIGKGIATATAASEHGIVYSYIINLNHNQMDILLFLQ